MPPLSGVAIAVTRAAPDAAPLAGRLAALGAEPVITPGIETVFTPPGPLDAALERMRRFDWIVFSSRYSVDAVLRRDVPLEGPRLAAVGPATARALGDAGLTADLVPAEHSAAGLLAALSDVADQRILFPCSAIAARTLPDGLRARGAQVLEVVAYETRPVGAVYESLATVHAITFTSPSTVEGILRSNRIPHDALVVCIGPTTAAAARDAGLTVHAVAQPHSEDGLIDALLRLLARDSAGGSAS